MNLKLFLSKDKYYILLGIQLIFLLILPFIPVNGGISDIVISTGLSSIVIASTNTLKESRKILKIIAVGLGVLFVLLTIISEFSDLPNIYLITFIFFFILMTIVVGDIIMMLLFSTEIKISLIAGAIGGYLLIAICFAFFCLTIGVYDLTIFTKDINQIGFHGIMYFSLITMTTIGYGDISPVNQLVQTVATIIGVVSQFYMAVVVAVIVGKLMNQKS